MRSPSGLYTLMRSSWMVALVEFMPRAALSQTSSREHSNGASAVSREPPSAARGRPAAGVQLGPSVALLALFSSLAAPLASSWPPSWPSRRCFFSLLPSFLAFFASFFSFFLAFFSAFFSFFSSFLAFLIFFFSFFFFASELSESEDDTLEESELELPISSGTVPPICVGGGARSPSRPRAPLGEEQLHGPGCEAGGAVIVAPPRVT
mmetsp:Transcript_114545/g.311053  ORF Transcript_114545/g.311053 Transcript_114545/m.311053 type:complete len:207 (-) Transcript_114545:34-654(-)